MSMLKFIARQLLIYLSVLVILTIFVVSSSTYIGFKVNQQNAELNAAGVFRALEARFQNEPESKWPLIIDKLKSLHTRPLHLLHFDQLPEDIRSQKEALYAGEMLFDYNNHDYTSNFDMFKPSMIYQRVLKSDLFFAMQKRAPEIIEYQKNNAWIHQLAYSKFKNTPESQWSSVIQYIENVYQVGVEVKNLSTYTQQEQQDIKKWGYFPTQPFHGVEGYIQFLSPNPNKVIIIGPYRDNWVKLHPHIYALIIDAILLVFLTLIISYPLYRDLIKLKSLAQNYGNNAFDKDIQLSTKSVLWSVYQTLKDMGNSIQSLIKRQTTFANMVAHEIKTPLAQVHFTLRLLESAKTNEARAKHILSIKEDIIQIDHLINQQLDYSKYSYVKLPLNLDKVSLPSMVEKIVTIHRTTYADKAWHFTCDHPNIMVLLDKFAIQKVLNNLLINAYKYGGDIINVSISIFDNDAVIKITDNGEGFLFDLEDVLNQPFNSQSKQSSGLGLAIVWRIVEAHHGRITLDNTSGAVTFEIKLPIV
ncbi:sensor histidine kinase [Cysteiniphilum sp. 6C5]|uniref:sensor histidine kinase n=1 Tax=unclassified Cysteiniphilum TaxID=2610889 RepID=UPI003F875CFF